MGILVATSDFNGQISTDKYTIDELDVAIDTYEKRLIYELLGVELADLFFADLDANGVPQTQRFVDIYEAWTKDINNYLVSSLGIKEMVKKYIIYYYTRTQSQTNTIQGDTQVANNLNNPSAMAYTSLVLMYNECIKTYEAIQYYINANSSVYPEYKGMYKMFHSWA
jgi:hypothetical protein